jgi:curved DNA-binding protein CbpA
MAAVGVIEKDAGVFYQLALALPPIGGGAVTSLYELLGVRPGANEHAIEKAFREAVKAHHPDRQPNNPDAALELSRIIEAGAILRDPYLRAAYDQSLGLGRRQAGWSGVGWSLTLHAGATALAVVSGLIFGSGLFYGLLSPWLTTSVVTVMKEGPAAGTVPIVDTAEKETVGAAPAGGSEPATTAKKAGGEILHKTPGAVAAALTTDKNDWPTRAVVARAPVSRPGDEQQDASHFRTIGMASYRNGDFSVAIANFDAAIRLDPADAQAYDMRGNARDETGIFDGALADYAKAIHANPDNPVFFHDRAVLWFRKGDLEKAIVDLDRAIRFTFSDPGLYCIRGLIWYEKGRHERAVADFDNAMKLDLNFAAACISRGLILHSSEVGFVYADFSKAIKVSPGVFDVSQRLK